MATPTIDRPGTDGGSGWHGPAEVRAALEVHATDATLAVFDRGVDEAYGRSVEAGTPEPLRTFLDHWWFVADVAGNGLPAGHVTGGGREAGIAAWEAAHPGEKLLA
jgi:hypothetical protein